MCEFFKLAKFYWNFWWAWDLLFDRKHNKNFKLKNKWTIILLIISISELNIKISRIIIIDLRIYSGIIRI